jgi:hypothetical protein
MVRWLSSLSFSSLVAGGRSTAGTPSLGEPAVEHDDDVRRLSERGTKIIVNVPVVS